MTLIFYTHGRLREEEIRGNGRAGEMGREGGPGWEEGPHSSPNGTKMSPTGPANEN